MARKTEKDAPKTAAPKTVEELPETTTCKEEDCDCCDYAEECDEFGDDEDLDDTIAAITEEAFGDLLQKRIEKQMEKRLGAFLDAMAELVVESFIEDQEELIEDVMATKVELDKQKKAAAKKPAKAAKPAAKPVAKKK